MEGDGVEQILTIHNNGFDNLIGGTFGGTYLDLDLSFNEKFVNKEGQSNNIYIVGYNYNPKGAVNEVDKYNNIDLFPNPAKGTVNIIRNKDVATEYALVDQFGREIQSGKLTINQAMLNLGGIPAWMYYLRLDGGVVKLIVQ